MKIADARMNSSIRCHRTVSQWTIDDNIMIDDNSHHLWCQTVCCDCHPDTITVYMCTTRWHLDFNHLHILILFIPTHTFYTNIVSTLLYLLVLHLHWPLKLWFLGGMIDFKLCGGFGDWLLFYKIWLVLTYKYDCQARLLLFSARIS